MHVLVLTSAALTAAAGVQGGQLAKQAPGVASGAGLLITNALLDRVAFTDPPKRRFLGSARV